MQTPMPAPRTIIVLNDYCHVQGGASRVAVDEAVALAELGEAVIFLGAVGPVCAELANAPLRVVCLNQPELLNVGKNPGVMLQGLWNRAAKQKMLELLQPLDPRCTIVHLHGYTKALTSSPVRAATERGFPVVCTLHDFYTACPNGAFFDFQQRVACPKRGLSLSCITSNCDKRHYIHKLYRVVRSVAQKYLGRLPSAVQHYITLSENSARLLRPYLPAAAQFHPLENINEVPQATPVDVASKQAIVAVGRLDIEKGVETLLAAAKHAKVPLVFVGDGPLRPLVEATPHCRVTGWVNAAQVLAELEQARCLVFPSLWYETYGLVVTEAAARGIPAIVSSIAAASERITHGVEGWHFPAGDVAALATLLTTVQNDATVQAAGAAAYARFWANPPTRTRHTHALQAIYAAMLG
jgi:glycosyltransferase involved in cell wall biosynthesis